MNLQEELDDTYHYSIKELAFLWNVSREWIRRRFRNEPGVLRLQFAPTEGKRKYCPLRIPGRVARKVREKMVVITRAS